MRDIVSEEWSAYEHLKQEILDGSLEPGQKLVETSLAEQLRVSRTPIREALTRLEHDGLAERGARGYLVRERSPEEILDIYETRCVLEAMAGRVAAERRTDHDLRQLTWIASLGESVDTDDHATMADHNRQFHRAVWRAAHHETLYDLLQRLDLHVGRYPATTLAFPGRWEESLLEHAALLAAIEKRDAVEAENVAYKHFLRARDIRLELTFGTAVASTAGGGTAAAGPAVGAGASAGGARTGRPTKAKQRSR
jgi:DNA-binding GntR family transcriptional regulator